MDPRISLIKKRFRDIGWVLLFGSGKGGVGKSLISSAIAYILSKRGYRTGYLDLDLHGPAGPILFPVEERLRGGKRGLAPPVSNGVKVMSVGLFLSENPLPLMGKDKPDLLLDLLSTVDWGETDYLIMDLPPGMGDELTLTQRLCGEKACLILLTTASELSLNVVKRLAEYARIERISTPGVIVNMVGAFGDLEAEEIAKRLKMDLLAKISYHPKLDRFMSIREKLENVEEFKGEIEEAARSLLRYVR